MSAKASKPVVMKGKLKFKGSGGARKPSSVKQPTPAVSLPNVTATSSTEKKSVVVDPELDDMLTESQKRHMRRQLELESKNIKKAVKVSYREKVEEFNMKLSTLTEHNDIPRVSAAGNG